MFGVKEVRWSDPKGMFARFSTSLAAFHLPCGKKPSLELLYEDVKDVFLLSAGVAPKPELSK